MRHQGVDFIIHSEFDQHNFYQFSPLLYALITDDPWLLEQNIEPHSINAIHYFFDAGDAPTCVGPLLLAAAGEIIHSNCSLHLFRLICRLGANVNLVYDGHPILWHVFQSWRDESYSFCKVLLEWGANPSGAESVIGFEEWYKDACIERVACRKATVCIMGLSRIKYGARAPADVLKLIAKRIWNSRFEEITWMQETKVDMNVMKRVGNTLESVIWRNSL